MAKKKPQLDSPFARTTPLPHSETANDVEIPAEGRTVPTSVGLKESEVELLDRIAEDYGIARNAVMRWALRWFLSEHQNGRVSLASDVETPETPKNKLNMP